MSDEDKSIAKYILNRLLSDRERIALADHLDNSLIEKIADGRLMNFIANVVGKKLDLARKKGRHGWWDKDQCSIEDLGVLLASHFDEGDQMLDVGILAFMIYFRECAETSQEHNNGS